MFYMTLQNNILNIYGRYMHMKLFIDVDEDEEFRNVYSTAVQAHNAKLATNPLMVDSGFDLFTPANQVLLNPLANKVDFRVVCACRMVTSPDSSYNTGFYMYPRSSISKTPLRLANSVGIIDAGYRGHLIGMFDLPGGECETITRMNRYLQICAPGLVPIYAEIVNSMEDLGEETERGGGGFGSTGL
jgi:dUTP pyrophosphatase